MSRFAEYHPDHPRGALPPDLVLRDALHDDAPAIARLVHERDGGDPEAHRERIARELPQDPPPCMVVAEVAGRVVGFGRARWFAGSPGASAPEGWYLLGVIVEATFRRRGIGEALTRRRLEWIAGRAGEAYYFANSSNQVSIDLHAALGFAEVRRNVTFPGVVFEGGEGVLYRVVLPLTRDRALGPRLEPHRA